MIREKRTISGTVWAVSILAALMFGAFLASPVPKIWADQIVHILSAEGSAVEAIGDKSAVEATASAPAVELIVSAAAVKTVVSDAPEGIQPDYVRLSANRGGVADRKEMDVLIRLINAEAYGLSYKAKLAVGQVVMNRLTGPYYGDDLMAIMTAPHQFTPICDGSAYKKEIEPDSIKAANAVLDGAGVEELTSDTYYFVNPDFTEDKTIETKMKFVCEIDGLHFYKPPER